MATKEQVNAETSQAMAGKSLTSPSFTSAVLNGSTLDACTASADPTVDEGVATKQYADAQSGVAPGTVLVNCETAGVPTTDPQISSKAYVDAAIAVAVAASGGGATAGTPLVKDPLVFSSSTVQAHGLGVKPKFIKLILECINAEGGFSAGQRILLNQMQVSYGSANASNGGMQVAADAVNLTLSIGAVVVVNTPATGNGVLVTAANWRAIATPYKF